jgi:DNA mismatch repair protein MutL
MLAWAVEEAYHGLLMTGKHPLAIINLSLPPEEVDINIHPRKSEVKFRDESAVFAAVQKAARQALVKLTPVPKIEAVATAYRETSKRRPPLPVSAVSHPTAQLPLGPETPAASLPVLRVLGQLLASYIIAEGPRGLYLIDQHAAHERILFEKIKKQQLQPDIEVQGLLEPALFEVSPQQEEVLKAHYSDLAQFGFSISPFGARTYLVRTVPALLYEKDWQGMVTELLDLPSGDKADFLEKLTVSMACHSAVRAGQKLSGDEMRELLRQLEQVSLPNTCPHGRPTMVHITSEELKREFRRV